VKDDALRTAGARVVLIALSACGEAFCDRRVGAVDEHPLMQPTVDDLGTPDEVKRSNLLVEFRFTLQDGCAPVQRSEVCWS
jgi:hypothetical protein